VKVELVEAEEILVLEFAKMLPIRIGVFDIIFDDGVLKDKMKVFYIR